MAGPVYTCENEECEDEGLPFVPALGDEAVCPECGWMLVALVDAGGDLV